MMKKAEIGTQVWVVASEWDNFLESFEDGDTLFPQPVFRCRATALEFVKTEAEEQAAGWPDEGWEWLEVSEEENGELTMCARYGTPGEQSDCVYRIFPVKVL